MLSCQTWGGQFTNKYCSLDFNEGKKKRKKKKTNWNPTFIYTDCTNPRRCIENKDKLVRHTETVAKCIAIIWWLQQ